MENGNRTQSGEARREQRPAVPRRIASEQLLGEARSLVIVHQGREYMLRVTQNGKLILTA